MKRVLSLLLVLALAVTGFADDTATADENVITITTKQAFLKEWNGESLQNATAFELIKTDVERVPNWPKWVKAIFEGWSIDAGFSYDSSDILDTGALLLGRNFGTLENYLPLEFPMLKYITITLYPVGVMAHDLMNGMDIEPCSGVGYIKAEIRF